MRKRKNEIFAVIKEDILNNAKSYFIVFIIFIVGIFLGVMFVNQTSDKNEIETLCNNCFSRLKDCNYFTDMNFDEFVENLVDLYCTLNIIHPFREGNGRTQRIFISQLIRFNGYDINFSDIDSNLLMIATIKSAQGITDTLFYIFKNSITKI